MNLNFFLQESLPDWSWLSLFTWAVSRPWPRLHLSSGHWVGRVVGVGVGGVAWLDVWETWWSMAWVYNWGSWQSMKTRKNVHLCVKHLVFPGIKTLGQWGQDARDKGTSALWAAKGVHVIMAVSAHQAGTGSSATAPRQISLVHHVQEVGTYLIKWHLYSLFIEKKN